MARDEEFRKVAEDLRALGRSLARDFWQAADQARRSGGPPSRVIGHGLRRMAYEARTGLAGSRPPRSRGGHGGYGPHRMFGPPPGYQPAWDQQRRPGPPRTRPGPRVLRPAPPPVRRRWDATTVLGLLIVLFGSAWLLSALGALQVPVEGVLAVGLVIVGAAVIITARTDWSLSRKAWPLLVGGGLVLAALGTSGTLGIGGALDHVSFGTMHRTAVAGGTVYGGFGTMTVDAGGLAPGSTIRVQSAAGRTEIDTPPGVPLEVHARVLAGQVCVAGRPQSQGLEAGVDGLFQPGVGRPVTIDVHQLAGLVLIGGGVCSR